ncbi:MAG: late competence development ComFB family protein [Oscillospiraceae bacterium]|jgi:competence protein ComFB|nr:late competence development ComFB family protein [Oscillospiraceae bacterium]
MAENFSIHNVSEDMIEPFLDECMAETDMCTCPRCRLDVLAFALNAFPPHYVVTDFGDMITRAMSLSTQFRADIVTAVMEGVKLVSQRPRCGNTKKQ